MNIFAHIMYVEDPIYPESCWQTLGRDLLVYPRYLYLYCKELLKTLAANGLEEPWNFQELLTESVGPVHFS